MPMLQVKFTFGEAGLQLHYPAVYTVCAQGLENGSYVFPAAQGNVWLSARLHAWSWPLAVQPLEPVLASVHTYMYATNSRLSMQIEALITRLCMPWTLGSAIYAKSKRHRLSEYLQVEKHILRSNLYIHRHYWHYSPKQEYLLLHHRCRHLSSIMIQTCKIVMCAAFVAQLTLSVAGQAHFYTIAFRANQAVVSVSYISEMDDMACCIACCSLLSK